MPVSRVLGLKACGITALLTGMRVHLCEGVGMFVQVSLEARGFGFPGARAAGCELEPLLSHSVFQALGIEAGPSLTCACTHAYMLA